MEFTSIADLPVEIQEPIVRMLIRSYAFASSYVYHDIKTPEENLIAAIESYHEKSYDSGYDSAFACRKDTNLYCQAVYR
jgi:hypothetical protein